MEVLPTVAFPIMHVFILWDSDIYVISIKVLWE